MPKSPSTRASALVAGTVGAVLALGACSTPSSGGGSSTAAQTSGASSAGPAAASIPYDGPEQGLPVTYQEPAKKPAPGFTVGFMNIFAAIPALKSSQDAAQKEVESSGGKFIAKDDQLDVTTQVNHCNEFIAQHVNAILLYPLDPKALQPCLTAAAASNISVVVQNAPVAAGQPLLPTLVTDNVQGFDSNAYQRAKAVAAAAPGSSYAIIGLAAPVAALTYYAQRQRYWADKFGLKFDGEIDAQTDNATGASTAIAAVLGKYSDVQNVFAYNDNAALAASTTARASGKSKVRILGSNGQTAAISAVKNGMLFGTTWVDFPAIGRNQALAAIILLGDKTATLPKFATTTNKFVTAADANSVQPVG